MKIIIFFACIFFFHAIALGQPSNPQLNKALADSLGADEYGMKMYTMVILKTGSAKIDDKAKRDSIFRGHMQNIGRMAKIGKLVIAGPFESNDKNYRGIYIFNATLEETKKLVTTDPAVSSNLLEPEIFQWYGSAALPIYLPYHDKIWTKKPG